MKGPLSWGELTRKRGKTLILLELAFLVPVLTFVVTGEPFFQPSSSTAYADTLAFRGWHATGLPTWDLKRELGTAITTPPLIPALASLTDSELVLRVVWLLAHLAAPPLLLKFYERGDGTRVNPAFLFAAAPGGLYAFIMGDFLSVLALDLFVVAWMCSRSGSTMARDRFSWVAVLLPLFGLIHTQLFLASILYFGALCWKRRRGWRETAPFLLSLAVSPLAVRYMALEIAAAIAGDGYVWSMPIALLLLVFAGIAWRKGFYGMGGPELATVAYCLFAFSLTLSAFPLLLASLFLIPPLHSALVRTGWRNLFPVGVFLLSTLVSSAFLIHQGLDPSETAYANPNAVRLLAEIQDERVLLLNTPPWIASELLGLGNEVVTWNVDSLSRSVLDQASREVYSFGIGYVVANKDPKTLHWFAGDHFDEELYTYNTDQYTQLSVLKAGQPTQLVELYDIPGEEFDALHVARFDSDEEIEDLIVWASEEVTGFQLEVVDDDFLRASLASVGPFSFTVQTNSPAIRVEPESSLLLRLRVREGVEYLRVNGWTRGQLRNLFEAKDLPKEWFHFVIDLRPISGAEISKIEVNIVGRDSGGLDIDYLAQVPREAVSIDVETTAKEISISAEAPSEFVLIARYRCCPKRISIADDGRLASDALMGSVGMFPTYSLPPGESRLTLWYGDEVFSMYPLVVLVLLGTEAAVILFRKPEGGATSCR